MALKRYFQATMSHPGLNQFRVIKANSEYELQQKCNAVRAQWDEQWKRKIERDRHERELLEKRAAREAALRNDEEAMRYACQQSNKADDIQRELDTILLNNLFPLFVDFDKKYIQGDFSKPYPNDTDLMKKEPHLSDEKYNPKPTLFVKLSKKKLASFNDQNKKAYSLDHNEWAIKVKEMTIAKQQWNQERDAFLKEKEEHNQSVDEYKRKCKEGDEGAVAQYFEEVLDSIVFPVEYSHFVDAVYQPLNHSLVIDYKFPNKEDIPNTKAVTYIKTRKEYKTTTYPESYMNKKYDEIIYQMVLVLFNTLFAQNDQHPTIEMAVVNGRIDTVDKRTGNPISPIILSVSTTVDEFKKLNLKAINPKEWFKSAKGISAASLASITPVAPIISINKEDKRFIDGYNVVDAVNPNMNLAALDWQDFENLIRELFEKEFQQNGGEVKITQSSRDGGVDAVAFDPDPIRGGKIVIQAKRYTNVVGVSAVRDLYGTLINEGATKGILVTTAYYGNDAYDFAKGKPLTLLNGANLLALLEKHGYQARIDLIEAKKVLKETNTSK